MPAKKIAWRPTLPLSDECKVAEHIIGDNGAIIYQEHFAELAFDLLANSDNAKCRSHLCRLLNCSRSTIDRFMREEPSFIKAVESGLEMGAAKWRDRISEHAFSPTAEVNNGLIKLLSSNVYGIQEAVQPQVIVHTDKENVDVEKVLKERGIPLPQMNTDDVEE